MRIFPFGTRSCVLRKGCLLVDLGLLGLLHHNSWRETCSPSFMPDNRARHMRCGIVKVHYTVIKERFVRESRSGVGISVCDISQTYYLIMKESIGFRTQT